jgi:hypothetical protein
MHHWFDNISCFCLQVATCKMKAVCPKEATAICYVSVDTASCTTKLDSTAAPGSPLKIDTTTPSTRSACRAQSSKRISVKLIAAFLKLYLQFLSPAVYVTAVIYMCCISCRSYLPVLLAIISQCPQMMSPLSIPPKSKWVMT